MRSPRVATDGVANSSPATVTLTVVTAAYVSSDNWGTTFDTSRFLALTLPAYVPAGSTVTGGTFTHTYRSDTPGDTTCYYFEVYRGPDLLATHGSAGSPLSCNSTNNWLTAVEPLPEINTDVIANSVTIVLYVENSGGHRSQHSVATLGVNYSLASP